jgi:ribonuclease HI
MLLGLRKLRALGVRRCIVKSDSQVIEGHVEKEFTAKEPELIKYLAAVRRMEKHFAGLSFRHIPRSKNAEADELAKIVAQSSPMPADVFYQ